MSRAQAAIKILKTELSRLRSAIGDDAKHDGDESAPMWMLLMENEIHNAIGLLEESQLEAEPMQSLEAIQQGPSDLEFLVRMWQSTIEYRADDYRESAEEVAEAFSILKSQADPKSKLADAINSQLQEAASDGESDVQL